MELLVYAIVAVVTVVGAIASAIVSSGATVEVGIHSGGDNAATVSHTQTESSLKAGGLYSLAIGYDADISEDFMLRPTIGRKVNYVDVKGTEDDLDFDRTKLDLLAFYNFDRHWRLGAGFTRHYGVSLDGNGVNINFDHSSGFLLSLEYQIDDSVYAGLRYTSIEYSPVGSDTILDGSSIAVIGGIRMSRW
jgi:hypothetical protein